MSSASSFGVLGLLRVQHAWFGDGQLQGASFVVPADARRRLAAGRLQVHARSAALAVLVERNDDGAPRAPLPPGTVLLIGVRPDVQRLANVTKPLVAPGQCAFFENRGAFSQLDAVQAVTLCGGWVNVAAGGLAAPRSIKVVDALGKVVLTDTAADSDSVVSVDLRRLPTGRYRVDVTHGPGPAKSTEILMHPELFAAGAPVVCALRTSASLYSAPSPPTWTIAYEVPSQRLEYYIVARKLSAEEFGQLAVSDRGFDEDARPKIEFDRIAEGDLDAKRDLSPALLGAGTDVRIALFRSRADVARRQRAWRGVKLSRNGTVLIENLPAPGAERTRPQFVIHLAKP